MYAYANNNELNRAHKLSWELIYFSEYMKSTSEVHQEVELNADLLKTTTTTPNQ